MKKVMFILALMFFSLNVYAQTYTVDEVIEASKSNITIKEIEETYKKTDPDYTIKLVKSSDGGIDILYKNITEHIDYNEKENTLYINYQPTSGTITSTDQMDKLTNIVIIQNCILQLSPHYKEIYEYQNKKEPTEDSTLESTKKTLDVPGLYYDITETKIVSKMELSDKYANYIYEEKMKQCGTSEDKPTEDKPTDNETVKAYTVDDIIEASKNNPAIKLAIDSGKKTDPDYTIKFVKANDGGIDIVYKDAIEHIDFIKDTNTLEINYEPKDKELEYSESSFKLKNFSFIQDCIIQLSPYYEKIVKYKNDFQPTLVENSPINVHGIIDLPGTYMEVDDTKAVFKAELSDKYANYLYEEWYKLENESEPEENPAETPEENPAETPAEKPDDSSTNNKEEEENPNTGTFLNLGILSGFIIIAVIVLKLNKRKKAIYKI